MHSLYVLIKDSQPVYVGVSSKPKRRINEHKKTKDFTHYQIIKEYSNKRDALIAENSLIRFFSLFPKNSIVNSLDCSLVIRGKCSFYKKA